MLLPFWLALSASLALHIGVLLSPGWGLPLDDEPETSSLEATLVLPAAVAKPKPAPPVPVPAVRKRPPAKYVQPATHATPAAALPAEPIAESSVVPEPEPELLAAPVAPMAESETPAAGPAGPSTPAASVAVLPAPTFARSWPRAGRIVYQVSRGADGFVFGQSEQRWEHDGRSYRLHAETETTGLAALIFPAKVVQESRGIFDAAGWRPLEFETQREGKSKDSVRFDLEQGRIVLGRGGSAPFVTAAQDLLSLFYQLAAFSFDVPNYSLTVATGRKITAYAISVGDEMPLETPLGMRRVRHLVITAGKQEDSTEIWLDVTNHMPLKIRHRDRKGETFDQIATLIDVEPQQ